MAKKPQEYTKLDTLRHSCAHVMAHAIKDLYPQARFGVGPPVENGFYYDVELPDALTEDDLAKIEKRMAELIKANQPFERKAIPREEARKHFESADEKYKVEIISQINADEEISAFSEGDFTDLCRGPHVKSTGEIKAFKLMSIAGAYWRGDERNAMMQRIYGTAFFSEKDLRVFLKQQEEAKKRDHRKIGSELEFFSLQKDAGPGLIFFHPKGALLRHLIEQFVKDEHLKRGYSFVMGPQILKSDIWKISGHYDFYKENMFIFESEDLKEYAIKPMNCPGHMLIFSSKTRSYRDLPVRFFEMGNVCRYEKSGVLHGLLRVRNFTQDDAHIFCLPEQLEAEISAVIDFVFYILKTFGFEGYEIDLSTRPKESTGSDAMWEQATDALKKSLESKKLTYSVCPEGGAFYGPKIDIRIKDALGRSWQCSTIQCDFALPEKFQLSYIDDNGQKKRPVMLHRAILGSVERFMGCLLEHYAGILPLWLSPVQAVLIPISEAHEAYCREVKRKLEESGIRASMYDSSDTLNRRIRRAQDEKIPRLLIAGDREVQAKSVNVRRLNSREQTAQTIEAFVEASLHEIKNHQ